MTLINESLHVGPLGDNLKGGIKEVLLNYRTIFKSEFNSFSTLTSENKYLIIILFPYTIFKFIIILLFQPQLKIIHLHTSSRGSYFRKSILFLIAKYIFRKKCIFQIHGGHFYKFYINSNFRKYISLTLKKSDAVIFLFEEQRKQFLKILNLKNTYTIDNIIPKTEYKKNVIHSPLTFLFLGKINQSKGVYDLVEAILQNRSYLQGKINLYIGGAGEDDKLIRFINDNLLNDLISYMGWVSGVEKLTIFAKSDVLILPSYIEAMPMSVLEAMSYSKPIIATSVGRLPDLVKHKVNGILIEKGNVNDIFEAIRFYVENKNSIICHGQKSYRFATKYFPDEFIVRLSKIYSNL